MGWGTSLTARRGKTRGRRKLTRGATEGAAKPCSGRTHLRVEQGLEVGGVDCGASASWQQFLALTTRGNFLLTKEGGCAEGEALGQQTLDVAAGWNKPAEPKAEKTVERLRKPEGGTSSRLGSDCGIGCLR